MVGTQTCPTCGSGEFSDYTWGIPTGWIAKLATVALLIGLWKACLAHAKSVLTGAGIVAAYAFGVLTNRDARALSLLLRTGAVYLFLGWLVGWMLHLVPGEGGSTGKFLRALPLLALRLLGRWLPRLARFLFISVLRFSGLLPGKPAPPASKSKDKPDKAGTLP